MSTRTFKIGECCKGGIITVNISTFGTITLIGKEWDGSKGYSRSSNQSNAKEFTNKNFNSNDNNCNFKLFMFLTDLTTAYYANKIIDYIKSKIRIS